MTSMAALVLDRYAEGPSRKTVAVSLRRVLRVLGHPPMIHDFPWEDLTRHDVLTAWSQLSRAAPSVQRLSRTAVKHVLKECWRAGRLSAEQLQALLDDWPRVRGYRPPPGRALSQLELFDVLTVAQAQAPVRAARDAALIGVLAGTGCRRHEAVGLNLTDVDADAQTFLFRGKGNAVRRIPLLVPSLWHAVAHWLEVRGALTGPLFLRLTRWDVAAESRLAVQSVNGVLKQLADEAGVPFTPHDLRRTGITHLIDAGVDLDAVRRWAGHQHLATTVAYRRPTVDPVQTAAERLRDIFA